MERIQPPPNYYGAPYPQSQEMVPQNSPYPPQMGGYPSARPPYAPGPSGSVPAPEMMRAEQQPNMAENVAEFYESFNKLVSTNLGRNVIVHCSFTDSTKWHDKEFVGVLASAGDNYIIVYDAAANKHYLIVGVYIDFIEFVDKIMIDGVLSK